MNDQITNIFARAILVLIFKIILSLLLMIGLGMRDILYRIVNY